jgi:hypothetical protein
LGRDPTVVALSQHDSPQLVSQEEEPFEIEIVVPESPEAQDASAEEPEQQQVEEDEDGDDEEYSPLCDMENEKRGTQKRGSPMGSTLRSPSPGCRLYWYTWESPPHPSTESKESHAQAGLSTGP